MAYDGSTVLTGRTAVRRNWASSVMVQQLIAWRSMRPGGPCMTEFVQWLTGTHNCEAELNTK
jgi:hypothetical protein